MGVKLKLVSEESKSARVQSKLARVTTLDLSGRVALTDGRAKLLRHKGWVPFPPLDRLAKRGFCSDCGAELEDREFISFYHAHGARTPIQTGIRHVDKAACALTGRVARSTLDAAMMRRIMMLEKVAVAHEKRLSSRARRLRAAERRAKRLEEEVVALKAKARSKHRKTTARKVKRKK